jgi:hypothetical protein
MRSLARSAVAIALVSALLLSSHSETAAFGARLKMSSYYGRASATFQFTYTLNRLPSDGPCPMADVALTWDGEALGSVPLDCVTLSASGAVTPPADANALGNHQFCVGNESQGAPLLCVPYTIVPEPGQCDPTGNTSPPCVAATTTPFERDCVPTGRPSSPPCVTVTPIPIDCGNPSSPPCAETPAPAETATPTCQVAPGAPWCPTSTPQETSTSTPALTRTTTRTATPACDATASNGSHSCFTVTSTPTTGADDATDGISVNWLAVAVAGSVLVGTGAAAAGWWWWTRL